MSRVNARKKSEFQGSPPRTPFIRKQEIVNLGQQHAEVGRVQCGGVEQHGLCICQVQLRDEALEKAKQEKRFQLMSEREKLAIVR